MEDRMRLQGIQAQITELLQGIQALEGSSCAEHRLAGNVSGDCQHHLHGLYRYLQEVVADMENNT